LCHNIHKFQENVFEEGTRLWRRELLMFSKGIDKRAVKALQDDISKFQTHGQYADAAEAYARLAVMYLDDNPLIYAGYCHDAFRMWLKAENVENALIQANNAFRVLDDAGWLRRSMEQVLDLKQMIDELKAGGNFAEAASFANELDIKLAEFGLMLRPASGGKLPTICPACGAPLPYSSSADEIKCPSCGHITSAS
jgi:LSD1 subclass zinc finger protein